MVTAAKVKVLTNVCALVVCCACYVVVVVVAVVDVRGDYLWLTTLRGSVSAAMELLTPLLLLQSTGMGVVAALMMALGSVSADTTDFSSKCSGSGGVARSGLSCVCVSVCVCVCVCECV